MCKSFQPSPTTSQVHLQRARGVIELDIVGGKLDRFYQSGSSKVFLPKTYAKTIEAVLVNTAGGLASGDEFVWRLGAYGTTHLTVSTQTAERVYRSLGQQTAKMRIDMKLTGNASLHWLPQETIVFDGANFLRHLNVEMEGDSSFLASEIMVFGRTAMSETVNHGRVLDHWRISRDGKLIHAEALRLEDQISQKLETMASAAGNICLATTLYIGTDAESKVDAARKFFKKTGEVRSAISAWDGKLVIRTLCEDTARLKKLTAQYIEQCRAIASPRVWGD
jgi:urease accessory protein